MSQRSLQNMNWELFTSALSQFLKQDISVVDHRMSLSTLGLTAQNIDSFMQKLSKQIDCDIQVPNLRIVLTTDDLFGFIEKEMSETAEASW